MIGDVIRKENVTPRGAPAFRRLIKIGTEEHEQNGVMAPKSAATPLPRMPPDPIHRFSLCSGNQVRTTPITKICQQQENLNRVVEKKLEDSGE
jgi:hypothetical protein